MRSDEPVGDQVDAERDEDDRGADLDGPFGEAGSDQGWRANAKDSGSCRTTSRQALRHAKSGVLVAVTPAPVRHSSYRSFPGFLADQRLGGTIMWALPIVALLPVVLGLVLAWWRREERVQALLDGAAESSRPITRAAGPSQPPSMR